MAFLQIKATNPNLSFLLRKNPASGLIAKEMRKGTIFGYYSDDGQTFNIYFKDAHNEISYPEYKDQEFEYVNTTRYSSAQFVLNALSELCRDAFKKRDELKDPDEVYTNILIINMVRLDNKRTITAFIKHFSRECDIAMEEVAYKYYKITLKTQKSLYYLLNLTNLLAVFTVIRNKTEYLPFDEPTVEKYFSALSVIDAPYFIRYHFKIELLRSYKLFQKYKPLLEKSDRYLITMVHGDTVKMRMDAIENEMTFSHNIVDIGCGEGSYVWAFTKKMLKTKRYHAIDINEDCRNSVARKVRLKELTNVQVLDSIDTFLSQELPNEKFDFILGEVIEHMSLEEATSLVNKCLTFDRCNSVILTTPNVDFNHLYFDQDDKDLRHPDHKFEFSADEFDEWVDSLSGSEGGTSNDYSVKRLKIGDRVINDIPITLGVVFTRRMP